MLVDASSSRSVDLAGIRPIIKIINVQQKHHAPPRTCSRRCFHGVSEKGQRDQIARRRTSRATECTSWDQRVDGSPITRPVSINERGRPGACSPNRSEKASKPGIASISDRSRSSSIRHQRTDARRSLTGTGTHPSIDTLGMESEIDRRRAPVIPDHADVSSDLSGDGESDRPIEDCAHGSDALDRTPEPRARLH